MTHAMKADKDTKERTFRSFRQLEEAFFPKSSQRAQRSSDELPFVLTELDLQAQQPESESV